MKTQNAQPFTMDDAFAMDDDTATSDWVPINHNDNNDCDGGILDDLVRSKIGKRSRKSGGIRGMVVATGMLLFYVAVVRKFYHDEAMDDFSMSQ